MIRPAAADSRHVSVEIVWLGVVRPEEVDRRRRCRYCARVLTVVPTVAAEIEPHCGAARCPVCAECADGRTPVSPVRPG